MGKENVWSGEAGAFLEKEMLKLRAFNPKLSTEEVANKINELYGEKYGIQVSARSVQQKLASIKRKDEAIKEKWTSPLVKIYFMYLISFFPDRPAEWCAEELNKIFPGLKEQYGPFSSYEVETRREFLKTRGRIPAPDEKTLRFIKEKEEKRIETDEANQRLMAGEKKLIKIKSELSWLKKREKFILGTQNLQDAITTTIERTVMPAPLVEIPKAIIPKGKKRTRESVVLMLSDTHFGEEVSREETYGLGGYNVETAIRRLQYISDATIKITQRQLRGYQFQKLYVFGLGDWVSGTIHEELERTAELNIVEQSYGLAFVLSQMVLEWCQVFPEVKVVVIGGNHPRLGQKKVYKERYANWDYNCGLFLRQMLLNQQNCQIEVPRSFIDYQEVEGHIFALMHGDDIPMRGIMPYYGIQRAVHQLESIQGGKFKEFFRETKQKYRMLALDEEDVELKPEKNKLCAELLEKLIDDAEKYLVDKVCMGHFHDNSTLLNEKVLINGSVIGPNEYALAKFLGGVPMQKLFGVHWGKGKSWEFSLRLDVADKKHDKIRYQLPPQIAEVIKDKK